MFQARHSSVRSALPYPSLAVPHVPTRTGLNLTFSLSCALALSFAFTLPLAPASRAATTSVTLANRTFQIPAGYEITEISSPDQVLRPVNACFDDQGRLYVTDSSGSSQPPAEQAKDPKWRVIRLEDSNGDGSFDRSVVFADKLPMLQGILWHHGVIYIGGTPAIWTLRDVDGDGKADERKEWWNVGRPSTHCGNEVHGPYAGPDGYIYWTKGAFEPISWTNSVTSKTYHDRGAHIFRARPDGSDMESIMTGGMDNPVEVAFTSDGECIFTSTFIDFSQPGFRDGLAHAIFGGVYGKLNSNIDDLAVKRTSPEVFHPFVQYGAGAPSGLCRYTSTALGTSYKDTFFATLFNLHKVTHHALRPQGASFTADSSDFVATDDVDFHPTDVIEAPDGSLLIVDTGGWYKLCCPTSQLWKPDMLGHIYRVHKSGSSHTRIAGFGKSPEIQTRKASRNGSMTDWESRITQTAQDPFAQHEIIHALIHQATPEALQQALKQGSPAVQRGALIALAERDNSTLTPAQAAPFLTSDNEPLRKAAEWIVQRRPEWGIDLARWAESQLPSWIQSGNAARLSPLLPLFLRDDPGRTLIARCAAGKDTGTALQQSALATMASSGLKTLPPDWLSTLVSLVQTPGSDPILSAALKVAASLKATEAASDLQKAIHQLTGNDSHSPAIRAQALASLAGGASLSDSEFNFLVSQLTPNQPPAIRSHASRAITRATLSLQQKSTLAGVLANVGPLELSPLLAAFEAGGDAALGKTLLQSLDHAKSRGSLRAETLKPRLSKFPPEIQKAGEDLLAKIVPDSSRQAAQVAALLDELKPLKTDIRHGQAVFNSTKAACVQCHRIGYAGGNVGPDLTRIGEARTERDLLEALVFPSASFVRSYEPVLINTKTGDTLSGIVRQESDSEILLVTGPNQEQKIAKNEIVDQTPGAVSIMPGGLHEQMNRQELADLIAFLKNTKWGAN